LEIPSTRQIEVNEKNIPTGNIITNNYYTQLNNIGTANLDTCFQLVDESNVSIIKLVNAFKKLDVKIWMERGDKKYKYVQVYIPPERDCIAIEPMTCMPDVFNNKKDMIILTPGNSCEFIWGVTVK
jgi:aldose 1-epimerase